MHYADQWPELLEHAEQTLRVEHIASATDELRAVLERARSSKAELFDSAVRASRLERAALDFATQSDAWPTKLKDGTWEITKKRRFGHQTTWHAVISDQGEPLIEPKVSASIGD